MTEAVARQHRTFGSQAMSLNAPISFAVLLAITCIVACGTDGGTVTHLVELAEMLLSADPRPRLGIGLKIPVIYAGNKQALSPVEEVLDGRVELHPVENISPQLRELATAMIDRRQVDRS